MSPQARMEFIKSELELINEQVEEAKSSGKRNSLKSKASISGFYEKKIEMAMEQLNSNQDEINWELSGIDFVAYDEAHWIKNLFRHIKKENIAGKQTMSTRCIKCSNWLSDLCEICSEKEKSESTSYFNPEEENDDIADSWTGRPSKWECICLSLPHPSWMKVDI